MVQMRSTWIHVCPAWVLGPRKAHHKFGGPVIGGIERVEDRLWELKQQFPDDLSSGHNYFEVRVDGDWEHLNSPNAISYDHLMDGITDGNFPRWSAFTHPAFGIAGVEDGAILSEDEDVIAVALAGHLTALERSYNLQRTGLGLGHTIWWPAFDSRLHRGHLHNMGTDEAWEKLLAFWQGIFSATAHRKKEFEVMLEFKPSVPGQRDFIPTTDAAIAFCQELNRRIGRKAMGINLEFAHALIGGELVCSAMRKIIDANLFSGLVHVNSAEKANVVWSPDGKGIISGTPGDDSDWPVGEGNVTIWEDQEAAIGLLDRLGATISAEHDIDPMGEDPFECYERSRGNLEKMIRSVRN